MLSYTVLRALDVEVSALLQSRGRDLRSSYPTLIRRTGAAGNADLARRVHAAIAGRGAASGTFIGNLLVEMHGFCRDMEWVSRAFDGIRNKNIFSWNMLIRAFAHNGQYSEALQRLEQMIVGRGGVSPNAVTFAICTNACSCMDEARALDRWIVEQSCMDAVLGISLINMYGRLGSLEDARSVLVRWKDEMATSIVAWNALMALYVQEGMHSEALQLLNEIKVKPSVITFTTALKACVELGDAATGMLLHRRLLDSGLPWDTVLANMLIALYGKVGQLEEAKNIFDSCCLLHQQGDACDPVCWTTMAAAYTQAGRSNEALQLYWTMNLEGAKPDRMFFPCLISACDRHARLPRGRQMHCHVIEAGFQDDTTVCNALVTMYGRCGCLDEARSVFDRMPQRNVVSWTAVITATAQNGQLQQGIQLFRSMKDIAPNAVTCLALVYACGEKGSLADARSVHALVASSGFLDNSEQHLALGNAVVSMYGKCGGLDCARRVFDEMKTRDLLSWDSMIAAYGHQGHAREALDMYRCLEQEGYKLDSVTFVSVLSALGHTGQVADCRLCLLVMLADHELQPVSEHYNCVLDSLGRAGWLDEAMELLDSMPFEPSHGDWMSYLGSCKIHGDEKRVVEALDRVPELYPEFAVPFGMRFNTRQQQ